jgi:hypothetical protein
MRQLLLSLILLSSFAGLYAQGSGNALLFDGINSNVDFGNAATFDIDTAVTYEVWIRPDTNNTGFIFNKWVNFQEDKQLSFSGDRVYFYLHNVFSGQSLGTATIIPLHQYTHIAATYYGTTARLYVNGVLDTSLNVQSSVSNSSGNLYMGFNPSRFDVNAPFKGVIDEFRIWNIARSESEIQATMNQPLNGDEEGLVGYWNFDEGNGLITADQTANGNDGTINGAVWVQAGILVDVQKEDLNPKGFLVSQNYPNPFNPSTSINIFLPEESKVSLNIYNCLGELVMQIINEWLSRGEHVISINAGEWASGIYTYKVDTQSENGLVFQNAGKMILLK